MTDYTYGERQFFDIKQYSLTDGKARGVHCIDVDLGDLEFTLIADRGLDIGSTKFKGRQVAFLSKNGVVSPAFYNPNGYGWLESFGGGLLVTCGLINAGEPCVFNGQAYGLHGKISNTPAENVNTSWERDENGIKITITGLIRETRLLCCDYIIHRSITAYAGEPNILLCDRITNLSDTPQPLMLLYHINFGYPLITPDTIIEIPDSISIEPFDEQSAKGIAQWNWITPPVPGAAEEVFLHTIAADSNKMGRFSLKDNPISPRIAVDVIYSADSLPMLGLWKNLRPGEYAVALEPCNNHIRGIEFEHVEGNLRWLEPGESVNTQVKFSFHG